MGLVGEKKEMEMRISVLGEIIRMGEKRVWNCGSSWSEGEDPRMGSKSCETKPKKGRGSAGTMGERGKESLLLESSRVQGRIIFHPLALSGILIMKVKENGSFVIRFGMKGAIPEGNIYLLKFCWIKEEREEVAGG